MICIGTVRRIQQPCATSVRFYGRCRHRNALQHQSMARNYSNNQFRLKQYPKYPQTNHKRSRQACLSSTAAVSSNDVSFFQSGPSIQFGIGTMGNHTHSSVVGVAGTTVTMASVSREDLSSIGTVESFLTVEYRQKTSGVGEIPGNRQRDDGNRAMSTDEILACRAIDRSLRPLLRERDVETGRAGHYHVHCSVHAADLWPEGSDHGHPVVTCLNSASAALCEELTEPVAATAIAVLASGSYVQDPGPAILQRDDCVGELLFAGTRDRVIMMEWTSARDALPESKWAALLELAITCIQPALDSIEALRDTKRRKIADEEKEQLSELRGINLKRLKAVSEHTMLDEEQRESIRVSLGLNFLSSHADALSDTSETFVMTPQALEQKVVDALLHCRSVLGNLPLHLFGHHPGIASRMDFNNSTVFVHDMAFPLLSKRSRGKQEQVMQEEVFRLVGVFLAKNSLETEESGDGKDRLGDNYRSWIQNRVFYRLINEALWENTVQTGSRSDRRKGKSYSNGWKTVRPIKLSVPALPASVHGSAIFARGDTQVLCTVTLGAPRQGQPMSDPFKPHSNPLESATELLENAAEKSDNPYDSLPVGSLRFLKTQEAMVSDMNSRKSKADKEQTGDSGSLSEVKRAFLQYDFPSYSTGKVPTRGGTVRRSVGHGALAERAILPMLPDQHVFPYAIRMTSEVTDSNGSSSMASVCGATLALLDAGVPLKYPVVGISVGVAVKKGQTPADTQYSLLLDITGTEDHYGGMDFKIAGSQYGVTAIQLDVKTPLPLHVITEALYLAKRGRVKVLDEMHAQAKKSVLGGLVARPTLKDTAPRVEVVRFDPERKRDLIGPGGVVLRQLEHRYGVDLDLTQEGQCLLFGANKDMVRKAKSTVMDLVAEICKGEVYTGTVVEIKDFGAIIELLRNKEGLLHVSEMVSREKSMHHPDGIIGFIKNEMSLGDEIEVMCTGVDPVQGSVKLSQRALTKKQ